MKKIRVVPDKVRKEQEKKLLLDVLRHHENSKTFQDLLYFTGFNFVGGLAISDEPLKKVFGADFSLTEEEKSLIYYEHVLIHPEKNIAILCFLGTQGTGTFGFELTKENFKTHIARLEAEVKS